MIEAPSDFSDLLNARSVEDILAERVRVILGSIEYTLPVLTIEAEETWRATVDASFVEEVGKAGANDLAALTRVLEGHIDRLLDALLAYDTTGVLPPRDVIRRDATQVQVLRALVAVRQSVSPLVVIGLMTGLAMVNLTLAVGPNGSVVPMSSPPLPTAGRTATSDAN